MPRWLIPRLSTSAVLCCLMVAPLISCSKRVASSTGEAASASKEKSAAPVETIIPESVAAVPGSGTFETAREPEAPPSALSESARESVVSPPSAPPASTTPSASSAPPAAPPPSAVPPPSEGLSLADIFFDFDQHTIRRDAQATLSANAAWITSKPGKTVLIEGHCDERGTQAYNLVLGEKRARSTKRYLEDLGVPASRLKTTSYGEMRPSCKVRDEDCYQQNRRAHFVVQ
jgi:peptidoglycan-associated lipoprotein